MTKRTGPTILLVAVALAVLATYVVRVGRRSPADHWRQPSHLQTSPSAPVPAEARPAKVRGGKLKGGAPGPEWFDVSISAIPMDGVIETDLSPQDIPPLTKPPMESGASWQTPGGGVAEPGDEVLGIVVDGVARAYATRILNYHWVVNDVIDGRAVVVFWDPIAQAAAAYQATVDRKPRQFGATGLFYRGNALSCESETGSLFLPVLGRFVTGLLARRPLRPIPLQRCEWSVWLKEHPETRVLSFKSGYEKPYNRDPFAAPASVALESIRSAAADPQQRLAPTEQVLGFVRANGKACCCAVNGVPGDEGAKPVEFGGAHIMRRPEGSACAILPGGVWPQQVQCTYSAWYGVHPDTEVWPGTAEDEGPGIGSRQQGMGNGQ